jgi:hypothetical protein
MKPLYIRNTSARTRIEGEAIHEPGIPSLLYAAIEEAVIDVQALRAERRLIGKRLVKRWPNGKVRHHYTVRRQAEELIAFFKNGPCDCMLHALNSRIDASAIARGLGI